MNDYYDLVRRAADFLRGPIGEIPDAGIVLGSGLGDFTDGLQDSVSIPYGEIPHWPASAVVGHAGKLVAGTIGGRRVAALSGRAHFYEGHTMQVATFATRVLGLLGLRRLILTNAAGGINLNFKPGTLMVIDDHITDVHQSPCRANDVVSGRGSRHTRPTRIASASAERHRRSGRIHCARVYVAVTDRATRRLRRSATCVPSAPGPRRHVDVSGTIVAAT